MATGDPFTDEDFERIFDAVKVEEQELKDGWTQAKQMPGLTVWKFTEKGDPVRQLKGTMKFPGISLEEVFEMTNDPELRVKWDEPLQCMKVIESDIDGGWSALYSVIKLPGPLIKRRDFVSARGIRREANRILILLKPTTHPSAPEKPDFIRGGLNGAFILQADKDDPNSSEILFYSKTDLKGKLPMIAINFVSTKAAVMTFESIPKFYAKEYSKRPKAN